MISDKYEDPGRLAALRISGLTVIISLIPGSYTVDDECIFRIVLFHSHNLALLALSHQLQLIHLEGLKAMPSPR